MCWIHSGHVRYSSSSAESVLRTTTASGATSKGTAAGRCDEIRTGYTRRGFVGFRHSVHVYVFRRPGEEHVYGNAREGGGAQACPILLRTYSVERILNRCSVVRSIVGTITTIVNVSDVLCAGLLYVREVLCLTAPGLRP